MTVTAPIRRIEISANSELLKIVEDARSTNTPRLLRRRDRDVALLLPIVEPDVPRHPRDASVAAAIERLHAGFGAVAPVSRPEDFRRLRRAFEDNLAAEVASERE